VAATLAWGRRGINLNASVWHLNVSRELLLDLRDSHDVKPVPAPARRGGTGADRDGGDWAGEEGGGEVGEERDFISLRSNS